MFIKVTIFLLSIILAANTALGQTDDDKILKESYKNCVEWSNSPKNLIPTNNFWYYMGKNGSDYERIITYFGNNPRQITGLDLKHFSELFKIICTERGVSVKDWAASRKANAEKKTLQQAAALERKETDDGSIISYTVLNEKEKEILKKSYDDCRRWLNKPLENNIGISEFCSYMGLNRYDNVIDNFLEKNRDAHARMNEHYVTNPGLTLAPIDIQIYSGLFKYICDTKGVFVKHLVAQRKIKAGKRDLAKYLSLSPEKRD
ncbi:uncharacterized protein LOC126847111 [Adelges cooleyi]|uniref:uncharacterized protein LOC126847111 n=1 Tax=Adelges cooleyi TaxID=133065 RepID=UPI002180100E|nr:uncharacterized protein LOC126847111 [Adelges cooleyi]